MAYATLHGRALPVDPNALDWNFSIKTSVINTIGGRVVQIFGTSLGTLTLTGNFGTGGWERQRQFYEHIRHLVDLQKNSRGAQPFRFNYSLMKWNFDVLIQNLGDGAGAASSVTLDDTIINPKYELTLFLVQDNTGGIVRNIRDQFIARLLDGVGFEQTDFNGPPSAPANPIGKFRREVENAGQGVG